MSKALVLFSGGMDSTTGLYWALAQGWEVSALCFDYPSRPNGEIKAAEEIAQRLGVPMINASLPFVRTAKDLANVRPMPEASAGVGYVPMRNMMFYAVAGYFAELYGMDRILGGHTKEDSKFYSDASPDFFRLVESVYKQTLSQSYVSSNREIKIILPLAQLEDAQAGKLGKELGVPFSLTWSCWHDGQAHCGRCYSCLGRQAALDSLDPANKL